MKNDIIGCTLEYFETYNYSQRLKEFDISKPHIFQMIVEDVFSHYIYGLDYTYSLTFFIKNNRCCIQARVT